MKICLENEYLYLTQFVTLLLNFVWCADYFFVQYSSDYFSGALSFRNSLWSLNMCDELATASVAVSTKVLRIAFTSFLPIFSVQYTQLIFQYFLLARLDWILGIYSLLLLLLTSLLEKLPDFSLVHFFKRD